MVARSILTILSATVLFLEVISAQYNGPVPTTEEFASSSYILPHGSNIGGPYGSSPVSYGPRYGPTTNYGLGGGPSSGGGFLVTSSSPISPTGISVVSENTIDGAISITGQLPFLGAVALDGALPSSGAGGINYGCGTGSIGIVNEGLPSSGYNPGMGYGAPGMGYPSAVNPRPYNIPMNSGY